MTNILDIKKSIKKIVDKMKKTTNIHQKTKKISKVKIHLNITKKIDMAEKTNIHQKIKIIDQGVVVIHQEIAVTAKKDMAKKTNIQQEIKMIGQVKINMAKTRNSKEMI